MAAVAGVRLPVIKAKGTGFRVRSEASTIARKMSAMDKGCYRPKPRAGYRFLEVPEAFVDDARATLQAKMLKAEREVGNDIPGNSLRSVSHAAYALGNIDSDQWRKTTASTNV